MVARKTAEKTAVAVAPKNLTNATLAELDSAEKAMEMMVAMYGDVVNVVEDVELGNGYVLTKRKDRFIGVPLLLLATKWHPGTWNDFVSLVGITMDGSETRFVINDGSTGLAEEISDLTAKTGRAGGWFLPYGLRRSQYSTCPQCGKPLPERDRDGDITVCRREDTCNGKEVGTKRGKGETYYIALSPEDGS